VVPTAGPVVSTAVLVSAWTAVVAGVRVVVAMRMAASPAISAFAPLVAVSTLAAAVAAAACPASAAPAPAPAPEKAAALAVAGPAAGGELWPYWVAMAAVSLPVAVVGSSVAAAVQAVSFFFGADRIAAGCRVQGYAVFRDLGRYLLRELDSRVALVPRYVRAQSAEVEAGLARVVGVRAVVAARQTAAAMVEVAEGVGEVSGMGGVAAHLGGLGEVV